MHLVDENLNSLIIVYYDRGHNDMTDGKEYNAPDHPMLRRAYALGYEDEIMGTVMTYAELLKDVNG